MIDNVQNDARYNQAMDLIEQFITKATEKGGFIFLTDFEQKELSNLSLLAKQYEDNVLNIMPLPLAQ